VQFVASITLVGSIRLLSLFSKLGDMSLSVTRWMQNARTFRHGTCVNNTALTSPRDDLLRDITLIGSLHYTQQLVVYWCIIWLQYCNCITNATECV